jgi:hypothetical protein
MEFKQYDSDILFLRLLYIFVVAVILTPLFLKNKLHSLQKAIEYFSVYIYVLYVFILTMLIIEKPSLEKIYPVTINWVQTDGFSMDDIPLFYAIFSSFYLQTYLLTFKRNLISNAVINRADSQEIEETGIYQYVCRVASRNSLWPPFLFVPWVRKHSSSHHFQTVFLQHYSEICLLGTGQCVFAFQCNIPSYV